MPSSTKGTDLELPGYPQDPGPKCVCGHPEFDHSSSAYQLGPLEFRPCHRRHPPCRCTLYRPKPKKKP